MSVCHVRCCSFSGPRKLSSNPPVVKTMAGSTDKISSCSSTMVSASTASTADTSALSGTSASQDSDAAAGRQVEFDANVHLISTDPLSSTTPTATMRSLSLPSSELSPVAYTGPFPLLSAEGVRVHRQELLREDVLENCMSQTWASSVQLRGMAGRYSGFLKGVWDSEVVRGIVSQAAGVELVPVMDFEICHANVQVRGGEDARVQMKRLPIMPEAAVGTDVEEKWEPVMPKEEDMVVEWHKDCYPFVVIVMLSDPKGMSGGETAIRKGDGEVIFVKAPEMVGSNTPDFHQRGY